jgi:hypothetical protein
MQLSSFQQTAYAAVCAVGYFGMVGLRTAFFILTKFLIIYLRFSVAVLVYFAPWLESLTDWVALLEKFVTWVMNSFMGAPPENRVSPANFRNGLIVLGIALTAAIALLLP